MPAAVTCAASARLRNARQSSCLPRMGQPVRGGDWPATDTQINQTNSIDQSSVCFFRLCLLFFFAAVVYNCLVPSLNAKLEAIFNSQGKNRGLALVALAAAHT